MSSSVTAVHRNPRHGFSKMTCECIRLLQGRGVEGDAHCGETVQHVYLKRRNPAAPNRMQVHLLAEEDLEALGVAPGSLGENITTCGIDLATLPLGSRLHLGSSAVVELTGLRTPCAQIEKFRTGLLQQMFHRSSDASPRPRAGVMAIVLACGHVMPQDEVVVALPEEPHQPLRML